MTTPYTVDEIAESNPHLTRAEVARRAALTPEMLARIAAYRGDYFVRWLGLDETDEQIALGFVAADAASERDALREADRAASSLEHEG